MPMNDVTRILSAIEQGDPQAAEQLLPLVYDELRKLAAQKLAQEKPGQTLQATALVHEAYLRLVGRRRGPALGQPRPLLRRRGRGHAADPRRERPPQAARRSAAAAGSGSSSTPTEIAAPAAPTTCSPSTRPSTELAADDPQAAELVKLRYFAGSDDRARPPRSWASRPRRPTASGLTPGPGCSRRSGDARGRLRTTAAIDKFLRFFAQSGAETSHCEVGALRGESRDGRRHDRASKPSSSRPSRATTPAERAAYLDEACGADAELRAAGRGPARGPRAMPAASWSRRPSPGRRPRSATASLRRRRPRHGHRPVQAAASRSAKGAWASSTWPSRTQPVRRKVALKIIKPGMDTQQVIARFEAERQALALMDHPNIAKVLDAGTTDSGPALLRHGAGQGRPDHRVLRPGNSSRPRERLELFVPVCQAIQHAHQKGIIHRDIKPSNVLVTLLRRQAGAQGDRLRRGQGDRASG